MISKMRVLLLLFCVALSVITTLATTPISAQEEPEATVTVNNLNMRTESNTKATIVAVLPYGTTLDLDGRDNNSQWLHATASTGAIGWVAKRFVTIRRGFVLSELPVLTTAPAAGGTNPPATGDTGGGNNPPPVVGGSIGGGFELGGQVQDLNAGTVAAMQRAGMRWVKRQAHAGDGNAVGLIAQAHANGFKILLSVIGDKNAVVDSGYQDSYASYVAGLAAAGADAIEVWNEMNIDREWKTGSISPQIYTSLLAKSYNAIKSANANTMVISGSPAPTGAEGAFGLDRVWNDDRYYQGMAAAGAGRYADCIGVHYNEGIISPNNNSGDPRDGYGTRYFRANLNRALAHFKGKKACFTELGYLTSEGYPPLPGGFAWAANVTVNQQAQWLAQAAVLSSNSGRVRMMIIFNVDFTHYGEDPQAGFAIIRPGGGCPACETLGNVAR